MNNYDIAIIGLGPAGCIFAKYIDKKFKVIALDKKNTDGFSGFQKPCGGLLSPDAQKALAGFNLTLPKAVLADPQIFSVRTIDLKSSLEKYYQRHYINIHRHKFDLWLQSLIPSNVEILNNTRCVDIKKTEKCFVIKYKNGTQEDRFTAKYIIGADGAASIVRKILFPSVKIKSYLSVQQWFPDTHNAPFYSCIFDPDITDCYSWGLTKDNYFIFGGAYKLKSAKDSYEKLKSKLSDFGFNLSNPVKTEACIVNRPKTTLNLPSCSDGAFLIGEAAGFISPSSLEGISYGINSGYALCECFNKSKDFEKSYKKKCSRIRLKLLTKNIKSALLYNTFLRKIIMKSGLNSIDVISGTQNHK